MVARIGIDLGGTKIEGLLMDAEGVPLKRTRVPTPQGDYAGTLRATVDLIRDLEAQSDSLRTAKDPPPLVGVGMPGSVSTVTGAMKNCNSTCLNGRYFRRDLGEALGRPVAIANDADCFALSEAVDGAGAHQRRIFGAILGTGVGGGLVESGAVLQGPNGLCGEWGHNLLPAEGRALEGPSRPCFCGRQDCVETYLSGPGLSRTHRILCGEEANSEEIGRRASAGDDTVRPTLDLYIRQLAFGLSQIINFLDPEVIVLGGGVSNIARLYDPEEGVPGLWHPWVTSDAVETSLRQARHGDSSGVRGAAWLSTQSPDPLEGSEID